MLVEKIFCDLVGVELIESVYGRSALDGLEKRRAVVAKQDEYYVLRRLLKGQEQGILRLSCHFIGIFNNINSIIGYLQSVYDDSAFWSKINNNATLASTVTEKRLAMYDVFISHANADKASYVDDLKKSLSKLNIQIFYDKDTLEWGDNWKNKILEGVDKAEFAIIVISENFFGREWTEKELTDFLSRQNRNGQKIILPILHNITVAQLQEKYPAIADIQALDSSKYSCDEIALKFAAQLIKRLKA